MGGSPGAENFSSSEAPIRLVRFNEMTSVTDDVFYLELVNIGDTTLNLNGLRIEVQGSVEATYECSDMMLESGNTFWLSEADLGFIPGEGDRVFLRSADGHLLDAVLADDTLRGRYPDGTGQWFYPAAATWGAPNVFAICQDIVINEIMFNPPGDLTPNDATDDVEFIELFNITGSDVNLWDAANPANPANTHTRYRSALG